jgi:hypothetical protein
MRVGTEKESPGKKKEGRRKKEETTVGFAFQ